MADSKQILVQLLINHFKSRKDKNQKFFKELKEINNIQIVLTVGVFLRSKKSITHSRQETEAMLAMRALLFLFSQFSLFSVFLSLFDYQFSQSDSQSKTNNYLI